MEEKIRDANNIFSYQNIKVSDIFYDNIPDDLKKWGFWGLWKLEPSDDPTKKGRKVPRQSKHPMKGAKSNDPTTWTTYGYTRKIQEMIGENWGLAFFFDKCTELVAIDIDDILNDNGEIKDYAAEIIKKFANKSYIEVSTSGKGVHIICYGKLPDDYHLSDDVEIYDQLRYFAITGRTIPESGAMLKCQEEIDWLVEKYKNSYKSRINENIISRYTDGSNIGNISGLRVENIGYPQNAICVGDGRYQGSHPFHGSTTGYNFTIDTHKNVWKCFRKNHDSGGGPLELYAIKKGIIRCEDSKPGCLRGDIFWATIASMVGDGINAGKALQTWKDIRKGCEK